MQMWDILHSSVTLQGNQPDAHMRMNKSSCFKLAYISGKIIKFNKDETDKCFITMRFGEPIPRRRRTIRPEQFLILPPHVQQDLHPATFEI